MRLAWHRRPQAAGALVVLLAVAACGRQPSGQSTASDDQVVPVVAQPAQRGALRAVVRASGVVTPAQGAEFLALAPEPALVQEITKNAGDAVASGDILVRFALPAATDAVARQQAELARAQAALENARISQARTRDFVERGLLARRELDALDRELEEAGQTVARAQEALESAERAAARAVVMAPFDGIVAARLKNPGEIAQPVGDPVLRIVDPRRLEVSASIPVADASRVVPGATARLAGLIGDAVVTLTVAGVAPPAAGSGTFTPARLLFVDAPAVDVDMPVELDIDAEARNDVVFVPPEAVIGGAGDAVVYVAVGSQARRRTVTTGITDDERVEITSGLDAGELVITRGQANLPDGAAISVDLRTP